MFQMNECSLMRKLVFAVLLCLASCPLHGQGAAPKREFRGIWISTVINIDWPLSNLATPQKQQADMLAMLDNIAAAGFNAVMFQVRSESDAMYDSPYEPWSNWLTGQQGRAPSPYYDPLAFVVDEGHKRGLEVHAWFNPYRVERQAGNYTTDAKHVSKRHPEWVIQVGTIRILNPGLQAVRDYVASVVADVVRRYDVDGAHMDDYFYTEGITTQDAAAYAADPRGMNLGDWRRDNVNRLVKQISDSIGSVKPNVRWGMSPAGTWKNGVPTSGVWDVYNSIYCDAVAWLTGKYIDYLAPQLYWSFSSAKTDYRILQPWWASQMNGRHFYPGLAAYRIGEAAYGNAGVVAAEIRLNRSTGNAQGCIQFTAHNITENTGRLVDTLVNDVYKYRALPPVFAWKDTLPPNAPRNIRYAKVPGAPVAQLMWDVPPAAADGDTAKRYVVYRFDHPVVLTNEIDDARNIMRVTSLRSIAPPMTQQNQTAYFVVTALDQNNNESIASPVAGISAPETPVLAAPVSGATDRPQGVVVSWNSVALASAYHLQVSTDPAFAAGFIVNDQTLTDSAKAVSVLEGQQRYYWRVRAVNAAGWGAFSDVRTFTTGFPATPLPVTPSNFLTNAPQGGTLVWRSHASSLSYRVQLSTAADFSTTLIDTAGLTDTTLSYAGLAGSKIHVWRIAALNPVGVSNWSEVWRFRTATPSAVGHPGEIPTMFALAQNYPNPFNPTTTIRFSIASLRRVHLEVYDVLGRSVGVLVDETLPPGEYAISWNASHVPSGVYVYTLRAGTFTAVKKLIVQK